MQLTLQGISKRVGSQTWLHEMSIAPQEGAVTVLLGATQAGKTSLMRIMAGLDAPSAGQVRVDGRSVLGCPCASARWPWCTSSSSITRRCACATTSAPHSD